MSNKIETVIEMRRHRCCHATTATATSTWRMSNHSVSVRECVACVAPQVVQPSEVAYVCEAYLMWNLLHYIINSATDVSIMKTIVRGEETVSSRGCQLKENYR